MGSLYIEIGQCGCQIGSKLNVQLSKSYYSSCVKPPHKLHAIMVDTEPKVLKPYLDNPPKWLNPTNIRYFEHGRGNNWSYGYLHQLPTSYKHQPILAQHQQFSHNGPNKQLNQYLAQNRQICEYVLERSRHQLEQVDCALSINIISSLGGGTGSGLGTKLIERISQQFHIDTYAHLILPNKSGETPLQVYNCALSLARIQDSASGIFTYQNDKIVGYLQQYAKFDGSLQQVNVHLASVMARMFKINDISHYDRFYSNVVSQCIISEQMKYLSLFGSQSQSSWENVFDQLNNQVKTFSRDDGFLEGPKTRQKALSTELLTLGKETFDFKPFIKKTGIILNTKNPKDINYEHIELKNIEQKCKSKKIAEAIMITNHSSITSYLKYIVAAGRRKLQSKAYLWHYQYVNIEDAIDQVQKVSDQYDFFVQG